jgi:uncharacterized protein (DUF2062 family)
MQIKDEKYFSRFVNFLNSTMVMQIHNFVENKYNIMFFWLRTKLLQPLLAFLKQGITPQKLAWSIAIGFVIGIFPMIGLTTVLAFLFAFIFRLNIAATQLVNYAVYPLQILLIIPFFQVGAWAVGEKEVFFSLDDLLKTFSNNIFLALQTLGWAVLYAVLAWFVIAIPLCLGIYSLCFSIFSKFLKEKPEVI